MPTLTLSRAQAQALVDFCAKHKHDKFFVAKDHGAYLGQTAKGGDKCLYYFRGMDPAKNADFYERSRVAFGGDDFGEFLPVAMLTRMLAAPGVDNVAIKVTTRTVSVAGLRGHVRP